MSKTKNIILIYDVFELKLVGLSHKSKLSDQKVCILQIKIRAGARISNKYLVKLVLNNHLFSSICAAPRNAYEIGSGGQY